MSDNFKSETNKRVTKRLAKGFFDINTKLEHLAIISYKVPVEKIKHKIPKPFKLWTFEEEGKEFTLVSAVPFRDRDFCFYKIANFFKLNFFQTNYRTYVIDERNGNHCAWFFGTTLGSITYLLPKFYWKMPWEYGKYNFHYLTEGEFYNRYEMSFDSNHGKGVVSIKSTKKEMSLLDGFSSMEEQILILTHPVHGYYKINDVTNGSYEIWHPVMKLHHGEPIRVYFELFEKLGFLTQQEMLNPHSILITPEIEFDILLPPQKQKIL
jgi:hypothetical protein